MTSDKQSKFSLEKQTDMKAWDQFVNSSPQGSVFCLSFFLNALAVEYACYFVYFKKEPVAAVCFLLDKDSVPLRSQYNFSAYCGLMFAPTKKANHSKISLQMKISDFIIKELIKIYKKVSFTHSYNYTDLRSFLWHNYHEREKGMFEVNVRYTGILDMDGFNFEDYLQTIRKVRRQEYNYAKNKYRVELREGGDLADLTKLYDLTFEKQGILNDEQTDKLLLDITKSCLENDAGRLAMAWINDQAIAANLFLFDKNYAYYLVGANHPEHRKTGASTFLLLKQIEFCLNRGIKNIDFVGVNSPQRGDYKLSFNPKIVPYFETHFGF